MLNQINGGIYFMDKKSFDVEVHTLSIYEDFILFFTLLDNY
jgi:hypothetical protein